MCTLPICANNEENVEEENLNEKSYPVKEETKKN